MEVKVRSPRERGGSQTIVKGTSLCAEAHSRERLVVGRPDPRLSTLPYDDSRTKQGS